MSTPLPRFLSAGDTALTIEVAEGAGIAQSHRVMSLYNRIVTAPAPPPGILDLVPAIRSLTVHYDPARTSAAELRQTLAPLALEASNLPLDPDTDATIPGSRLWHIPACYEPTFGPDIETVADHCKLTPWQVTALHACVSYRVFMVGFLPGHPYMGDLPPPLRIPRRDTPRTSVPAGSIAIATTMSVIYPLESPGGWHIIARTPIRLFDAARSEPSLLAPGDEVRFMSISKSRFDELAASVADGWTPTPEPTHEPKPEPKPEEAAA